MIKAIVLALVFLCAPVLGEQCSELTKVEPNHLPEYQAYQESLQEQLNAGIPEDKFNYYCINNVEYQISTVSVIPEYQKEQEMVVEIFEQLERASDLTDRILDVVPINKLAKSEE
ncbi:hypothetical protein VspSw1_67 [Vibrio phage VspSw_1]|uniref:Uncharacterized protein n=2 Tax=Pogseptimavirus VspSw1 TaxID=2733997 RepID=A0A411BKH1_9CAUD|nr:hypothetical protein HOV08_gp067 [Vibrio phage VspSw_1]QAY02140.1 hypothetical protein VspSw1_67 [Vibrio phage VspSw_1]QKN88463.1 hypothetical protein vBValSX1_70 [Vibrio phage vB_ValS_X1]